MERILFSLSAFVPFHGIFTKAKLFLQLMFYMIPCLVGRLGLVLVVLLHRGGKGTDVALVGGVDGGLIDAELGEGGAKLTR